jgi:hypothetical protein
LSAYKHIIDRLHQELGFWLQYRGEVSSADGVSVVTGLLKNWIREYLEDDGFEGDDKDQLIEKITGVTDHRLVFLTNRNGEEWSFEVRSLQEYMAAECLLSRSDSVVVEERLRSISLKSYWRNVYLFAAGKAFNQVDRLDLRDKIFRICYVGANTESKISTYSLLSEELALDLLESGAIKTNPRYQKEFISFLAGILKLPTSRGGDPVFFDVFGANIHRRIARVIDKQSTEMLVSILNSILEKDTISSVSIVSWLVLICLVDQGDSSAIKFAEINWPKSSSMQSDILLFADSFDHTSWIFKKLLDFVSCAEPREIRKLSYRSMFSRLNGAYPLLTNLMEHIGLDEKPKIRLLDEFGMYIRFIPLSFERSRAIVDSLKSLHRVDGHLDVYLRAETFLTCPNKDTLAEVLRFAAEIDVFDQLYILPWVIADCVAFAKDKDELLRFADMASIGELGDYEDWLAAERRWESKGLVIDDLTYVANHRLPFDLFISRIGYPRLHSLYKEWDRNKASRIVDLLVDQLPQILDQRTRHDVLRWVVFFGMPLQEADFTEVITPAFLKEVVIEDQLSLNIRWQIGDAGLVDNKAEWLDFLDWSGTRGMFFFRNISFNWRECLKSEFMSNPSRSGLLSHLFNSICDDESDIWKFVADCTVLKIVNHDSNLGFLLLLIRIYNSRDSSSLADDVYAEIRLNFHLINPSSHRRLFFNFTACLIDTASDRASLLVRLYEAISISDANAGFHYLTRMRELLANTPSSLQDRAELSRLKLPSSPSWSTEKS